MKRFLAWSWIWLTLFCESNFLLLACGSQEGEYCRYWCYGHRRAHLKEPVLLIPQLTGRIMGPTDVWNRDLHIHSYQDYFQTCADQAQKLRRQLIVTSALSLESVEASYVRLLAYGVIQGEIQLETLKDYILTNKSEMVLSLMRGSIERSVERGVKNNVATKEKAYTFLPKEKIYILDLFSRNFLDLLPQERQKILEEGITERSISQEGAKAALRVFEDLLKERESKLKGLIKKTSEEVPNLQKIFQSKSSNIASFGFVFFDENGKAINSIPFRFSPEPTPEKLEDPFYFVSGRRQRNYTPEIDAFPWTALPEEAPKNIDLKLQPPEELSFGEEYEIKKAFDKSASNLEIQSLIRLQKNAQIAYENYRDIVVENLIQKSNQHPFFDHIWRRDKRIVQKNICSSFRETLKFPAAPLSSYVLKNQQPIYYPKQNARETENEEGDFTHSEQYGFFQAASCFEGFLDTCLVKMREITGQQHISVKSYTMLIYTYNVMCVRCAQSTIVDFTYDHASSTYTPFNKMIDAKLDSLLAVPPMEKPERQMVFLAGYSIPYASELHNNPLDDFEHMMRSDGEFKGDSTLGTQGEGYPFCMPEVNPQMIYHYHIH